MIAQMLESALAHTRDGKSCVVVVALERNVASTKHVLRSMGATGDEVARMTFLSTDEGIGTGRIVGRYFDLIFVDEAIRELPLAQRLEAADLLDAVRSRLRGHGVRTL